MSYESPIRLIEDTAKIEIENMVVRAVKNYGLTIDRDALIKALNYDREQYEKGFEDGKAVSLETEAIPVEWIRKYTEENRLYQSDDFDLYISDMIADWAEEKKDIRICGICKHFLGGGDFGTCCDQTYDLKYTDSKVCEKYSERK